MKIKIRILFSVFLLCLVLTGCGEDPALTQFKTEIEAFCTNISELDTAINNIDATSDTASQDLLSNLDKLDLEFQQLAIIDFPTEFDYLEDLASQASEYMSVAVASYHEAYSNGSFNEYTEDYAHDNYVRAYKRVQYIIAFLHGETPQDDDLNIEY